MDYEKIWESVLEIVKEIIPKISFETWLLPLKIRKIDENLKIAYIEVNSGDRNDLIIGRIKDRYITTIESAFKEVLNDNFRVVIKKTSSYEDEEKKHEPAKQIKSSKKTLNKEKIFNPRYNFDNFVVGDSNKYAHAAALAVAESPSEAYNPLFIYGGSGLGKTHLMHAIGIYLLENNPNINVLYVSSEITNEFIRALSDKKMNEFKNKYREVDVLLIDDIQFLQGRDKIQEEFFYTFNSLYESNKQIVISSDNPPNKLVNLEERLRSRFQWNLIADIQPADYETRVAILLKKAENMNIDIDDNPEIYDVACMIAERIKDNIRELEGAFTRVVSFSQLLNEKLDKKFVKRTLNDIFSDMEKKVTPEKIKKAVCKHYGIKISEIESSKKTNNIAFPRQIAMYLIREMTDYSLPKIGQLFGGKHYTTVMYACEKIEDEIKTDKNLAEVIDNIKDEVKE